MLKDGSVLLTNEAMAISGTGEPMKNVVVSFQNSPLTTGNTIEDRSIVKRKGEGLLEMYLVVQVVVVASFSLLSADAAGDGSILLAMLSGSQINPYQLPSQGRNRPFSVVLSSPLTMKFLVLYGVSM
jgi:hypothetical protein